MKEKVYYSKAAAMNLTPDRQGYLGDVMGKTLPQLEELLERQKKILSKRQFIEHLPDKGEKTKKFVEFIENFIEKKKEEKQKSTLLVSKSKTETVTKSSTTVEIQKDKISESDLGTNTPQQSLECYDLGHELQQMSIDSNTTIKKEHVQYINSYESVIKRNEETPSSSKTKFLPHRSLKSNHIPPPPCHYIFKPKQTHKEEESAAYPPHYKFETKTIPIEESVKLIQKQRAKTEELNAEWATKRLADQMVPKMTTYMPTSNVDLQYRETKNKDIDSDDYESQDEDS